MTAPLVLLVDDSPLVTEALGILLVETGHRVATAGSVREAVESARAERPDVMLLDLTLPDGDGLQVLRTLAKGGHVSLSGMKRHSPKLVSFHDTERFNGYKDRGKVSRSVLTRLKNKGLTRRTTLNSFMMDGQVIDATRSGTRRAKAKGRRR